MSYLKILYHFVGNDLYCFNGKNDWEYGEVGIDCGGACTRNCGMKYIVSIGPHSKKVLSIVLL